MSVTDASVVFLVVGKRILKLFLLHLGVACAAQKGVSCDSLQVKMSFDEAVCVFVCLCIQISLSEMLQF